MCVDDDWVVCPSEVVPAVPEFDDCPDLECMKPPTANPVMSPASAKSRTARTAIERDGPLTLFVGPWAGKVFKYARPLLRFSYMIYFFPMIA